MSETKGHPKGLYLLYFTEMWERFSYYGMRAIFTLYMVNALLFDKAKASTIYGSYTGLVYLTPLLGGYIADKYWGNRKSIIVGGVLMAIGQFFMFMSGSFYTDGDFANTLMFTGLGFLIFGNGFFKPNISTMVGSLYPKGDSRVDSAFTIFYQGINLGALLAPAICGSLGEQYDVTGAIIPSSFKYGFLAACIGMILSLIAFVWLKNKYIITPEGAPVGLPPKADSTTHSSDGTGESGFNATKIAAAAAGLAGLFFLFFKVLEFDLIGSLIFSSCIVLPALIISDGTLSKIEKDRILVIYIIAFFVIFFWSAFEQAGASLTIFADQQTDRHIGSWEMPASWFQSINPLGIILLAPLFSSLWVGMNRRKIEPSSPLKMAIGLALLCLGYVVIMFGVNGVDSATKISMWWLIILYALHTMGEFCLSPIVLSMVSKLAPVRFASLLMGTWFLANAAANKLAGSLSALIPPATPEEAAAAGGYPEIFGFQITNLYEFFNIFTMMSGIAALLLFILYRQLLKMMHGVN